MTLSLPSFSGATRRLILINVIVFFALGVLHWISAPVWNLVLGHTILVPRSLFRGEVWQIVTYAFIHLDVLGILFGMLTLWFSGSLLESALGERWVMELYAVSAIGGGLIAAVLSFTHTLGLNPAAAAYGAWSGIFGLLVAIAMLFGDQEFLLWFVVRLKAKYMVTIYILIAVAILLKQADSFNALLQLSGALCGFLYVKFVPRRGLAFGVSERWFGARNEYFRWRRRRAARKFEVYMRKQNREVHFDKDGRYVDPDMAGKTERQAFREREDRSKMN